MDGTQAETMGAGQVVDIYEMTATQAGMLFHSLHAPESGTYVQQYWGRLEGDLDVEAFRAAWGQVIARHDIMRAACHWEGLDRPALLIHAEATPEWGTHDFSTLPGDLREAALRDWLAADRARGIDPGRAPLMRLALIRLDAGAHVLVWTFQHLLLDGWSGAIVVREALAAYAGQALAAPSRAFRDHVEWLSRRDDVGAQDYWRATLAGLEGPTPLAIDRTEGPGGICEHRVRLGSALTATLTQLARRERLTLATLLQGAWALVLSRYAGQEDVVFGTVLAGRPVDLPGAETMVGLFLQTIPVRVAVPQDMQRLAWLQGIQAEQRLREAHGHAALTDIRRWGGQPSTAPLFDSLLIVETYPESIAAAVRRGESDLQLTSSGVHERTGYPLTIKILPGEDVEVVLVAETDRIPAAALPRLASHLAQVLAAFTDDGTLADIDILTADEAQQLLAPGQGPEPAAPPMTLARVLAQAEKTPTLPALEAASRTPMTYAGLILRSGEIGTTLRDLGVERGDIVAICQDRTPDLIATMLAIWRCGAAYLPLDPTYPDDRIAYILADAGAVLAVVDDLGAAKLASQDDLGLLAVQDCRAAGVLPDAVLPDDLAYVLYTSGSTGRPKGVPIPHSALANFLASMLREPGLCAGDRLLALTTVAFDIAGLEIFGPLVCGGTVVIAETGAALDGARLAQVIAHERIDVMQATPAGWRVLRESGWQGAAGLRMLSGGEALDSALARDLLARGAELWNLYGPTETTIWSAALRVGPQHLSGPKVPVGGALDHTTLSLRDMRGRLVPIGVPGELWIGGAGLSPGYLGRPDLTADRFVTLAGARHYRTGDRVRLNEDGTIGFLGRFDDQVKLRGYRIELGEIEKQLETHPGVAQSVVQVRGDGNSARLVAWLRGDDIPAGPVLRTHLAEVLPAYMIPSTFVSVEAFPLTPNGKIDRKALRLPEQAQPAAVGMSHQDEVLAAIWADVLGAAEVRAADDFFELGGHSLSAMRMIAEIRRLLGVDLALREIFDTPKFDQFCTRVAAAQGRGTLPAVATGARLTLSAAQHRQWLLARLDPGNADYHLPLAVRLTGPLDADRLALALDELARRHDVLRCRFPDDRGVAGVEIVQGFRVELRRHDLSALPLPEQDDPLRQIREDEVRTPFDLTAAPPWRALLVRCAPGSHVLLLTLHHILADEWSFGVILEEIRRAYLAEPAPPKPTVQYADFAAWQRALSLEGQRGYWHQRLGGAPALVDLPTDRAAPLPRGREAGRAQVMIDAPTATRLEHIARENGTTLFLLLLAAYALLLHRHSGQRDLLIGTPVSNRRLPEFQGLVGLFVNTLAIRIDLTEPQDMPALLASVRGSVLEAHAHQDLPFEQVIDLLSPPRSESHAPLVQTMFSMPDAPQAGELAPGLAWVAMEGCMPRARFDMALELRRTEAGIEGHFDYARDLFDAATMARLAERLGVMLSAIALEPELPLAEVPLLSSRDLSEVLPPVTRLEGGGLFDRLALWAAERPDAPALSGLSYAALHARVRAGAAALRQQGIGTDRHVSFDPGDDHAAELLLSIIGAGAVAVPGDWPDARRITAADLEGGAAVDLAAGAIILPTQVGAVKHGPGLFSHLAALAEGSVTGVSSAAPLSDINGIAALAIAIFAGAPLRHDIPEDAVLITGRTTPLRIGDWQGGGDFVGPPEFPAALRRAGDGFMPVAGVQACILGPGGVLMPPGRRGRLALSGVGLARGHVGAPGRTAERFRPSPLTDPHAFRPDLDCLFDTGMEARWSDDGRIILLPPRPAPDLLAIPADVSMPAPYAPPAGAVEIALSRIWGEVLGTDPPGRKTGFFDLGGDSILAVRVAARAQEAGLALEPRDLFHHQTIAALATVAQPLASASITQLPPPEFDMDAIGRLVSFGDE